MKKIIFSILLLTILHCACAQTKFEREYRIKPNEVPALAISYVKDLGFSKKVKWYEEISQEGKSVEGKTKFRKKCYSIEFDTKGNLKDIEVKIKYHEIPRALQQKIRQNLNQLFDKHQIRKIQRQYTGNKEILKKVIREASKSEAALIRYEIIVKGRTQKIVQLYELLFSEEGELLEKMPIELRNTDNLEY